MLKEKLQKTAEIINRNNHGRFTIPTSKLYPHQSNADVSGIFEYFDRL